MTSGDAQDMPALTCPEARRDDVVESRWWVQVPDPYRRLESDVRPDSEVAEWVRGENAVADAHQ